MSMTMYPPAPDEAMGLPVPPGGGGVPPPLDATNAGPMPGGEGLAGLMAALGGGQAGGPPPEMGGMGVPPEMGGQEPMPSEEMEEDPEGDMDPIEHIQQAMKHLMMAMAKEGDEERGHGITKGMSQLQGLLAGDQKQNTQLSQLGG